MQLTTPNWVHHNGGAIFSVDIHPTENKLATSGQGQIGGEGVLAIWNLRPIMSEDGDVDDQRPLARLPVPSSMNCVRWSVDGRLLAAASDDHCVWIYQLVGRNAAGKMAAMNGTEQYQCINKLFGHTMEVLHCEWSPCGRFLASTSMDNAVIVWNAKKLPERVTTLDETRDGHTGPVKGAAWDPIGRYLVTQSNDRTLKLWNIDSWTVEKTFSHFLAKNVDTVMFARPAWAPDGQYLVVPSASNNGGPTAQLIRRRDWGTTLDLVGHRRAVCAVRSLQFMLNYKDCKGKVRQVSCFALASRDRSLSVWVIPEVRRPVLVIKKLFRHTVEDVAWRDRLLVACSADGTIKSLLFNEDELGQALTRAQMADLCKDIYRVVPRQYMDNAMRDLTNHERSTPANGTNRYPAAAVAKDDLPVNAQALEVANAPKAPRSEPIVRPKPAEIVPRPPVEQPTQIATAPIPVREQREEIDKNSGKRRIQTVLLQAAPIVEHVDEPMSAGHALPSRTELDAQASSSTTSARTSPEKALKRRVTVNNTSSISSPKTKRSRISTSISTERTQSVEESDSGDSSGVDDDGKQQQQACASKRSAVLARDWLRPELRISQPVPVTVLSSSSSQLTIPLPPTRSRFSVSISDSSTVSSVCFDNQSKSAGLGTTSTLCRVTGQKSPDGQNVWQLLLSTLALCAEASKKWLCACGADGSLTVVSVRSGRLHVSLQLDFPTSKCSLCDDALLVLTASGHVHTWRLDRRKAVVSRVSVAALLSQGAASSSISFSSVRVSPEGIPLVTLQNGLVYVYDIDLCAWTILDERSSQVRRLAQAPSGCTSTVGSSSKCDLGTGPLATALDSRLQRDGGSAVPGSSVVGAEDCRAATDVQLERFVSAARSLRSFSDYATGLSLLFRRLIASESTAKLMEFWDEMISVDFGWTTERRQLVKTLSKMVTDSPSVGPLMQSRLLQDSFEEKAAGSAQRPDETISSLLFQQ